MDERLSHLTTEQVDDLMSRYYALEPVRKLISEFNIKCHISQLYLLFPIESLPGSACSLCGGALERPRPSLAYVSFQRAFTCIQCGHTGNSTCRCEKCEDERRAHKQEEAEKRGFDFFKRVTSSINIPGPVQHDGQLPIRELDLQTAVYFLTVLQFLGKRVNFRLSNKKAAVPPLAPTSSQERQIVEHLVASKLLVIREDTRLGPGKVGADRATPLSIDGTSLDLASEYELEQSLELSVFEHVQELKTKPEWAQSALTLWREVATADCVQYLEYMLQKRGLTHPMGVVEIEIIRDLLEEFSAGKICKMIWDSAPKTSDKVLLRTVTLSSVATDLLAECQNQAERVRRGKWDVFGFSRNSSLPRSEFAEVVYDFALGIGEKGFTVVPRLLS